MKRSRRSEGAVCVVLALAVALVLPGCSDPVTTTPGRSIHTPEWSHAGSDGFHGPTVMEVGYGSCFRCHGGDFSGGSSGVGCAGCHSLSPLECNFCHGDRAADPDADYGWAPPTDLSGGASTTSVTVGAHRSHLRDPAVRDPIGCTDCHMEVTSVDQGSHLDGSSRAEIVFGELASVGETNPVWDRSSATCSNIYCHGEFDAGNDDNDPVWTDVGQGTAACGTCHGVGEDEPHAGATVGCSCHGSVVSYQDGVYTITDKSKHINGQTDF